MVKEERARVGVGRAKTYDAAPAGSHCTGGTLTLPAHADGTEGDRGAGGKQVCLTARRRLPRPSSIFFHHAQAAQGFPIFSFTNICPKMSHKFPPSVAKVW